MDKGEITILLLSVFKWDHLRSQTFRPGLNPRPTPITYTLYNGEDLFQNLNIFSWTLKFWELCLLLLVVIVYGYNQPTLFSLFFCPLNGKGKDRHGILFHSAHHLTCSDSGELKFANKVGRSIVQI